MNLAWTVEYAVQTRRALIVSFEWFLPLTGLRATKSSVDSRVFGTIVIVLMLVFVTPWISVIVMDI